MYLSNKKKKSGEELTISPEGHVSIKNEATIDLSNLLAGQSKVCVPSKLVRKFNRLTKEEKKGFSLINQDEKTAIELCYIIASNLSDTYFQSIQPNATDSQINGWKRLHSVILRDQVSDQKSSTYLRIVEFLQQIEVIELYRQYVIGEKAMSYRFTADFFSEKTTVVTLKEQKSLQLRKKTWFANMKEAVKNDIQRNIYRVLSVCHKLSVDDMFEIGKKKAEAGYTTKKGKKLTFLDKKTKDYFKDFDKNRVAVEDGIKIYKNLIEKNYDCCVGSTESGGRIASLFNLLPNWIREEIKVDGMDNREELDFTCLHPNVVSASFNGTKEHISHDKVVEALYPSATEEEKADRRIEVKIEHLSFFNKPLKSGMYDGKFVPGMQDSILFTYYMAKEPKMMAELIQSKEKNGYKSTSKLLFEIEVAMMTEITRRVNAFNPDILMIYVYDALEVDKKYVDVVKKIMNDVAKEVGVNTFVK